MSRGRTRKGRVRATPNLAAARPLLRGVDHGSPIRLDASDVGGAGDRWIEPFLRVNGSLLRRVEVRPEVSSKGGLHISLRPGSRVGAVPLLSPATHKVVAGLLISPRFRWTALGAVFGSIGFAAEPSLGGAPLVPGSAREVPSWLLAAPVLKRLEAVLSRRPRGFAERTEVRSSPRGRVDWLTWARRDVPFGRWTSLPCHFTEPDDDPSMLAAIRWTLGRLDEELAPLSDAIPARVLRGRIRELEMIVGPGDSLRPTKWTHPDLSEWVAEAFEAMGWVAEERGLGGARTLDGISWHLAVDLVWETWVTAFLRALAPRLGLVAKSQDEARYRLNWKGNPTSMGFLVPDAGLHGNDRVVWVDAKYKAHLSLLARHGWSGLGEAVSDAHRADLHQALAYASLVDVDRVDTVLAYPHLATEDDRPHVAIASLASGRRRVRLMLAGIPFGFRTPEHRERTLSRWRGLLAA